MMFLAQTLRFLKPMSPTTILATASLWLLILTIWLFCESKGGWAIATGCMFAFMAFITAIFAHDAMRKPDPDYNPRSVDAVWRNTLPPR